MSAEILRTFAEARARGDASALAALVPYARTMGITLELWDGALLGVLRFGQHLIGNPTLPALHGGAISALLESTALFQMLWEGDGTAVPRTIGLTIDYLRSGRPVDTFARGYTTRQGRRVANVRVEAWQDDRTRPIAVASARLLVAADP